MKHGVAGMFAVVKVVFILALVGLAAKFGLSRCWQKSSGICQHHDDLRSRHRADGAHGCCSLYWGIPGAVLMMRSRQAWIALDQWVHCLCYDDAMADRTFSARCWRETQMVADDKHYQKWSRRVRWIDTVFGKGHCLAAFESELNKQLPPGFID